jgi:hypothetical protein
VEVSTKEHNGAFRLQLSVEMEASTIGEGLAAGEQRTGFFAAFNSTQTSYQLFFNILAIVQSVAAIAINSVTIAALIKYRMVRKSRAYLLILQQSFVDVFLGAFHVLRHSSLLLWWYEKSPPVSIPLSWIAAAGSCMLFVVTLNTTFMIGVDRAIATLVPLSYKRIMTVRSTVLVLVLSWVAILLCNVVAMGTKITNVLRDGPLLFLVIPTQIFPDNYTTYFAGPLLLFGLASNAVLYGLVWGAYKRATVRAKAKGEMATRRITRTCVVTVSLMLLCWLPITVIGCVDPPFGNQKHMDIFRLTYDLSIVALMLPPYLNNILYAVYQKDFRSAYIDLFSKGGEQLSQLETSWARNKGTEVHPKSAADQSSL